MSRSRSPTRAGACRRSCCRGSFRSTPAALPAGPASAPPSARGWWEAHGGRIRAESAGAGRGSTFTFTLPVAGDAGEGREPIPVLVVDDDPETLHYLRDTLAEAGYAPVVTGEHEALARIIAAEKPSSCCSTSCSPAPTASS